MISSGLVHKHTKPVPDTVKPTKSISQTPFMVRCLSLSILLVIWQMSVVWFEPALLPSPLAVFRNLGVAIQSGELLHHLGITLQRVAISFVLAMALGILLGLVMGHFRRVDLWLDGILTLALNIPALVTIILCLMWFGLNEFSAILAVIINKAPNVAVTLREGAKAIDTNLMNVARAYRLSVFRTFTKVYLPQLYPYLLASARSGLALVWKIVLVVELIGCSDGVGFQLSTFFQFFDITSILAYTLAFAAVIYFIEGAVLRPWERKVSGWRQC